MLESIFAILLPVVAILTAFALAYYARKGVSAFLHSTSQVLKVDPTNYSFLKNASGLVVFAGALLVMALFVPQLKTVGAGLFASAGIVAAIVGFASQQAFSNIVGGIFIVIFKPFRVGDYIEVGNTYGGNVEDITLRHTVLKDLQNKRIIIPNASISAQTILNNHIVDERIRRRLEYRIALDADVELASAILKEEILAHPNCIDGRTEQEKTEQVPEVIVRVTLIGDFFVTIMAYAWSENPAKSFDLSCDVNKSILRRFRENGIEIPVPHRKIVKSAS
jgi:small-conductance mechanosensitive channel